MVAKCLVTELVHSHAQSIWESRRESVRIARLAAWCNYFLKKKKNIHQCNGHMAISHACTCIVLTVRIRCAWQRYFGKRSPYVYSCPMPASYYRKWTSGLIWSYYSQPWFRRALIYLKQQTLDSVAIGRFLMQYICATFHTASFVSL